MSLVVNTRLERLWKLHMPGFGQMVWLNECHDEGPNYQWEGCYSNVVSR